MPITYSPHLSVLLRGKKTLYTFPHSLTARLHPPSPLSLSLLIFSHAYSAPHAPDLGAQIPPSPVPPSATTTRAPPRVAPNARNDDHPPPHPGPRDPETPYWSDQSTAIPREPPAPSQSALAGQVESVELNFAPGVEPLAGHRRQIVACVLDLMQGKITHQKAAFLAVDVTYEDAVNKSKGRAEVEAMWWGLDSIMRNVEMLRHEVVKVEWPRVELEVVMAYTIRGLGVRTEVESRVVVEVDGEGRIRRWEDRWGGTIPSGKIAEYFRRANSVATEKIVEIPEEK
ncbi:hypothetical protein EDC01DRAFT_791489 [Geopyxis carbonaria]|nr:hypothetical protein EDC01DRAFT_791489 [Geopyxis carbonaria]